MVSASAPTGISALLRGGRGDKKPPPPRPEGPLVWLHMPNDPPADALPALVAALEDITLLTTYSGPCPKGGFCQPLPGPRRGAIDQFLAHWQPDLLVWGAAENGLVIARRTRRAGTKMLLAKLSGFPLPSGLKGRQLTEFLQYFDNFLLDDLTEKHRFMKHAHLERLPEKRLVACRPLAEIATPLPENESLLRRVSGALGPRPVWCAAMVSRGEIGSLLAAHRHAVRAIPNLLLVVVPRASEQVIAGRITDEGWRLARENPDTLPDPQSEVLLANDDENLGMWLRLATVSYMGGTLFGPEAADPFAAVALGSAVLAGPAQVPFAARYGRLAQAGALVLAETNGVLPARLVAALAPDRSAQLALRGWQVGSEGAEAVQILAREICAQLNGGAG